MVAVRSLGVGRALTGDQDVLERLAKDPSSSIRAGAARIPALPRAVLNRLAADTATAVRVSVAGNPATPPAALARLARMPGQQIAAAVAANPSTPAEVLGRLAASANLGVRQAVAANPATAHDVRIALAGSLGGPPAPDVASIDVADLVTRASRPTGGPSAERAITDLVQLWGVGLWEPTPDDVARMANGSDPAARLAGVLLLTRDVPGGDAAELLLSLWQPRSDGYARTVRQLAAAGSVRWPVPDVLAFPQARRVLIGASRPNHQLLAAAEHPDPWVRVGACLHPRPAEVLGLLVDDQDQAVARFAVEVFGKALASGPLL